MPGECSAKRDTDGRDFVFGLDGTNAKVFVLREFVEDVTCWCDRVRAEREREVGLLTRGDESPRQRCVACDARVLASGQLGWPHFETVTNRFSGLSEIESGLERCLVGRGNLFVLAELFVNPFLGRLGWTRIHP